MNKEILKAFKKDKEIFVRGAFALREEAKKNDYKITITELQAFLDSCNMNKDEKKFYELCILYAIE
jgi:ribonucleotide monophosphatase NagD (HAD superfamily)